MDVNKSLNPAPMGLSALSGSEEPEIEIEIALDDEDDEEGLYEDDETENSPEFDENLAETLGEEVLQKLADDLIADFDEDVQARSDWIKTYVEGLELLGLKVEERTEPWEGACSVHHPLLSETLVKFQAETMMETFPAQGPVKVEMIGKETPLKREAAQRVMEDMNYELTCRMPEYRPEHERMLWGLGLAGNAFKKVYYDPQLHRQTAMFIPAEDIVVPYGASSLETAERVTHVMRKTPNELRKLQKSGFYRDIEMDEPSDALEDVEKDIAERLGWKATTDHRYRVLEMHVDVLIEDDSYASEAVADKIALPYVVTVEKSSGTILAIRRNWLESDPKQAKRNHFVHYSYIPGFGFYAFGLIHLIGAFAKSGTSLIRQLVDAGTLSNLPGGFKTKGLRVKGDDTPIGPGEFRDVDLASGTMRDNIMPLPYKEPSNVLYQLLGTIVEEGRRFAAAADMKVSDMSAQAPVGTTLAILERTLKVMSAVQARIHASMKQEFKLLKAIIRDNTPDSYSYEPEGDGGRKAKQGDYDIVEVVPVSDPNAATMAQKIVQYQAVIQLAQTAPQIYDMPYLHRQMLEVLGIKNAEKLVPLKDSDDMKPRDPVSENMDILNNKPVKAFIAQDHEAHIAVHMAAAQDPQIQKLVGQSPNAQAVMAAMSAHVTEHLAFAYRKKIEEAAGVPYPAPEAEMSPELEVQISRLAAAAAQKVLAQNQAAAAQEAAQQAAQDPIVQMQMKELQIKEQDSKTKQVKTMADIAKEADKLRIEEMRIASQREIAGLQVGAKIAADKANLASKEQVEGLRVGVEIARDALGQQNTEADRQEKGAERAHSQQMEHLNRSDKLDGEERAAQERAEDRKAEAQAAKAKKAGDKK